MCIYVCVARVKSKSFVPHKSAGSSSGSDVRTNRAALWLQLAGRREKQEYREGKERAGQQLSGLHRTPVTQEVSAGHCFLDTPPQTALLEETEGGHLL